MRLVPVGRKGLLAKVDDEDFAHVIMFRWYACKPYKVVYAVRRWQDNGKCRSQYMHTLITGIKGIDHKNGDGLDCRKDNLRVATDAQNQTNHGPHCDNPSGERGVSWNKRKRRWQARITKAGKHYWLGLFHDKTEAAETYKTAATLLFGEFAFHNRPK
jgi:surface antigen